jgi:hypothetical protein
MTTGELDEIFNHIRQLKQQRPVTQNTSTFEPKGTMFAGDKDVFHETRPVDEPMSSSKDESDSDTIQKSMTDAPKMGTLTKEHSTSFSPGSKRPAPSIHNTLVEKEITDKTPVTFSHTKVNQRVSGPQQWDDSSIVTCDICSNRMILGKNLSGLVINDHFFACESCCKSISKTDLMDWTKSRMQHPGRVRSIGIWVTEQITKNR